MTGYGPGAWRWGTVQIMGKIKIDVLQIAGTERFWAKKAIHEAGSGLIRPKTRITPIF